MEGREGSEGQNHKGVGDGRGVESMKINKERLENTVRNDWSLSGHYWGVEDRVKRLLVYYY